MTSEKNLKSVHSLLSKPKEDAIPGSSKVTEETIKIVELNQKGMSGTAAKKARISEDFTDKERIRMEEEGLSEKDFQVGNHNYIWKINGLVENSCF